ncbi:MAG TPA: DUF3631 domain-containing protein [Xanthobacteraceae bacterium]|jgi:hypothetical protein|nr:DUF3631 domain-containing protein [Xanthobacteraceae bacterium]
MTLPPPNVCERIRKLHALIGSANTEEAHNAHAQLIKLLANNGLTWNDLPRIIADTTAADAWGPQAGRTASGAAPAEDDLGIPKDDVLGMILALIEEHIAVTAEECMAVALWLLHTWVFDRFTITPRLALLSPVRGCGKTTVLTLIQLLVAEGDRTDSVSAAAIYHHLDHRPRAVLLVDEADNLDLFGNGVLRAVFNSGHRSGGGVCRFVGGRSRKFPTFAPLAVAAIGVLPLPLLHRSVVINMQRSGGEQLKLLDESDPAFAVAREGIRRWAAKCSLGRDPEMPSLLRNRAADNWRVLLSIADDLGYGEEARSAAVTLSANRPDEDPGVTLLADIRTVFRVRGVDRVASSALVEALNGLDDGLWNEWRGRNDDRPPRTLTPAELSCLLRPFGIRPRTIWPPQRQLGDKSCRGYVRAEFEVAWRAYCPSADTPTQTSEIMHFLER